MTNYLLRSLTPQSIEIYKALLKNDKLTAKDIAEKLDILPHAVYRSIKQLLELGFVRELDTYPNVYDATTLERALNRYQVIISDNFNSIFGLIQHNKNELLDISFIQKRSQLLDMTNADVERAKKKINFIVSGFEVPAETVRVYKKAIDRGVKIRVLIQELNQKEIFKNWQKMGIKVKYFPRMEARIFIFDEKIVFFTSYDKKHKQEAIGMRFNHPPFARMMREMFDARWKVGEEID